MTEPAVYRALSELGLVFSRRETPRGLPYAGFRLLDGHGQSLGLTLLVEDGVARLTVHRLALAGSAWDLLRAGARLPLGALYRSPEDGSVELSLALRLGHSALRAAMLESLFAYTTGALASLAGAAPPALPALAQADPPGDPWARLLALGHTLQAPQADGNVGLDLALGPDAQACLRMRQLPQGWLEVTALRQPACRLAQGASDAVLHRLQRWARCGRYVLAGDGPEPQLGAHVAVHGLDSAAEALQWACSQAVAMLQVAQQQLDRSEPAAG